MIPFLSPLVVGSLGVSLLLVAFILNVLRRLDETAPTYLLLNIVGAGLAGWYAWVSGIIPFVVLEGVWATAALVRLLVTARGKKREPAV